MKKRVLETGFDLLAAAGMVSGAMIFLSKPGRPSEEAKEYEGRYFAHRGLHTPDKAIPENSLTAFAEAAAAGYGIELDIQLTKDGEIVVFHDNDLKRVCGDIRKVSDVTLDELRMMRLCGTEEKIPLFSEVLDLVDGRVPVLVELKTQGKRSRELCEKAEILLRIYRGPYLIESFDPRIVGWFRIHMPDVFRGQLACPPSDYNGETSRVCAFLLGNCLMNFIGRPQFIAYQLGKRPLTVRFAEILGAMKVAWTSHLPEDKHGQDAVIFEFYRPGPRF